MKFTLLALPVLAMALAPSAQACSLVPTPQPPERKEGESYTSHQARIAEFHLNQFRQAEVEAASDEAERAGYERALWEAANVIALVEVVAQVEPPEELDFNFKPGVFLKVVHAERGSPQSDPFKITIKGRTSCGPYGHLRIGESEIGDRFVIFAKDNELSMDSVIIGYAKDEANIYRTLQLFEK